MPRSVARRSIRAPARRRHGAPHRQSRAAAAAAARASRGPAASSSAVIVAKVLLLQDLARRERERRVELDLVARRARRFGFSGGSIACASRAGISGRRSGSPVRAMRRRQQRRDHLLQQLRIAPEEIERLLEQRQVLAPRHEHRGERRAEVVAVGRGRRLRPRRARRATLAGPTGMPGAAQHADEVQDVLGEASRGTSGGAPAP